MSAVDLQKAILARAYRAKAVEALELARRARQQGRETAHAGFLAEAIHWQAMSATSGPQKVTGPFCAICDHIEELHGVMGASHKFTPPTTFRR